ncbi:hypothetical protein Lesp02_29350 [Lentzea sp. NBRC 105346]|uniref:pyridoxamine 5'-phosphate oxidase family protein n=1 Tax=Lentzea sp. NBRC 105346 TaxID=3032205 RepID=UPI0024A234C0|nr:pyridoxamine 5'-phosphate oxidase family protein [Lentzea sp. NBRC 105346]GLZ30746.1 hypothetical protein Lesp02_29350 [Lentzea sp. NBRC 105346]
MIDRLGTERNAWMCTLRPDGSPHVTPVWFVYLNDTWWVASERPNAKLRNIHADPRVALHLSDGDAPVVAEGRAVVHRSGYPDAVVEAFHVKYGWNIDTGESVLYEVPVSKWLLSGAAQ